MASVFWEEEDDYFKLEPLTDEMVEKAEQDLKVKLPPSYIDILKEQNGGFTNFNSYPIDFPTSWAENHIRVDHIFGIGEKNSILDSEYLIKEWEMPEGLILFNGDGHTWVAFDYRNVDSNPSIVYVDNEDETIIKISNTFDEFLERLYMEEFEPPEEDDDDFLMKHYGKDDFEILLQQDDVEELFYAIIYVSQFERDVEWVSKQFLKLSNHPDDHIRNGIANNVWNTLSYQLDDETIQTFIEIFKNDSDSDVRMYAEMIIEKMNYSYEELKEDLQKDKRVSFAYQDEIYHINQHSNLWHISVFGGETDVDLQSFGTREELLNQATLGGQPLEQVWNKVKIL
ncbi:SMI1/KNR4 family protein [Peribacillus sp. NPDC097295]|uniref:SMI1/KNR4 family protein n=1 Tax=Peribacillus sp. NPDC097295 TaxID=3364402 RepID=UPI0037F3C368